MYQSDRHINNCQHKKLHNSCKLCGIYIHSNMPIKTSLYHSNLNCSAQKYLTHLRRRKSQTVPGRQISESTWTMLQNICDKFQYNTQTLALGLYLFARTYQRGEREERFWASAALLVASKAIQLDKRVPYINRYQKYAQKSFSQQQYQAAERTIFQQMSFDIQISTFVTFLHFYITCGVVFENDNITSVIVKNFEDELISRAKQFMKSCSFFAADSEKLSLSIIKEARKKFRLEPWNKQLEALSGFKSQDLISLEKTNALKPLCALTAKARQKLSNMNQHNTLIAIQNSCQLVDKQKLLKRKHDSILKSSLKQNSFRTQIQSQNYQTNTRKQTSSIKKYSIFSQVESTEKLLPISNFYSKRI